MTEQRRKTAHIISHTHWDREWYMPYEKHHVRLISLMDSLLETLDKDPEYRCFHLDGQTIVLEDYLQVRPEREADIARFVQEGRLQIGPWYILQDEFLTSSEANVRNLLVGMKDAGRYGAVCKIGYFPDSFGNMGQAPQLLRQAGIDNAIFGRGVTPTGLNNQVAESAAFESPYSEMEWRAPDGSSVLGVLFANWYNNGMEIPADAESARPYWRQKLADVERFASTAQLLFMNGCDHQPVQTDLPAALRTARALFPDMDFVHTSFPDYLQALRGQLPADLAVVEGELRSQQTDGWGTLVNTASARIYIKQENYKCQTLLEKVAEPLAAFAAMRGKEYPHHLFTYAWKTLMQNHPHDSICGCSVDEVHSEMMSRFAKSRNVAEAIADRALDALVGEIDSRRLTGGAADAFPFTVFNTTGWLRSGIVTVELDIRRLPVEYDRIDDIVSELKAFSLGNVVVSDSEGAVVPAEVADLGVQFGYELPENRFRQPYMVRRIGLTLAVDQVPALGYRTYAAKLLPETHAKAGGDESPKTPPREMENPWIRVVIADNGSLEMTDKSTGRIYSDLCVYEDCGDIGIEYVFKQPEGEKALDTSGLRAKIACLESNALRTVYEIVHEWEIPCCADETLRREQEALVHFLSRKSQRSERKVPLTIVTTVTLESGLPYLKVKTSFRNEASDHRLRVLLPTDIRTEYHHADSIFEVVRRDNQPWAGWTNPGNCQHQQAFMNIRDDFAGLTVANLGLPEYEVLRDGRNTIALTLLRAVGEVGDWGYFPTPEAQCKGEHTAEFALIPHGGKDSLLSSYEHAYQYQVPMMVRQHAAEAGALPTAGAFVKWRGERLAFSTLKVAEKSGDLILRWFNMTNEPELLQISAAKHGGTDRQVHVYRSNIVEESGAKLLSTSPGTFVTTVGKNEIITVGLK